MPTKKKGKTKNLSFDDLKPGDYIVFRVSGPGIGGVLNDDNYVAQVKHIDLSDGGLSKGKLYAFVNFVSEGIGSVAMIWERHLIRRATQAEALAARLTT